MLRYEQMPRSRGCLRVVESFVNPANVYSNANAK